MQEHLLKTYRDQIDTIDLEIIYLLSRRFENYKQIWLLKKDLDLDIDQSQRWLEVLSNITIEAKEKFLDPIFIENIWNLIHEESKNIQK